MPEEAAFQTVDWIVLAIYFAILAASGLILARKKQADTEDYFLANRSMPVWAVALSILATGLSAATFVGGPQQAFTGDLTYLSANIGGIIAALIIAAFFIPAFYANRVSTIYELLEHRFGRPAKIAASWMFMIGRVMASGSRIFIGAIPASLIAFGDIETPHLLAAIAILTCVGTVYTLAGGIRSVIFSDALQAVVFVGAALIAMVILLNKIPAPISEIVQVLQTAGNEDSSKLTVLSTSAAPNANYTLWTAIFGFSLLGIASYGTDQDLAQRMLTCKSSIRGSWSVIGGILLGIPVVLVFMLIGLLLFIFYQRPDIMGDAAPAYAVDDSRKIFLEFIIHELPGGLAGLMMAGLFAAGLSSLNSALNAMSSTFVNDFYRHMRPNHHERHYLFIGRLGVICWGVILGCFAAACIFWQGNSGQTLIDFALGVMIYAYAGLLAVFFTALFTKRGNNTSVIAALIVGFAAVFVMQDGMWALWTEAITSNQSWLYSLELAYPWKLLIATSLATIVCCIGSRPSPSPVETDAH